MEFDVKLSRVLTQSATVRVTASSKKDAMFAAGKRVADDDYATIEKIERVFDVRRAEGNGEQGAE